MRTHKSVAYKEESKMDNNAKTNPNLLKDKKSIIIAVIAVVVILGIIIGVAKGCNNGAEEDKTPVKTEIATDANGTPTVIQGTAPNGTLIENSTYPDGTEVEFATTPQGEYATEADGSYIINYIETTVVPDENNSNSDNSSNTQNSSDKNNNQSNSGASSNQSNSQSNTSNSSANNTQDSTKPNSSQGNTTKPNNSSSNTEQATTNNSSSNNNSSSSTATPPTTNGDANVDINASAYKVGDKIKVSYYLQSDVNFCGIQCNVNYDSTALKLDTDSIDMSNLAGPMCNPDPENQIRFLSSAATAVNDFTKEKLLFSCEFEVIKTTNGDVTINVVDILDNDVLSIPNDQYTITAKVEKL